MVASGNVLGSLEMGDGPVTLYAVFRQMVTLSYNGNGATSGSTAAQTGYRYYNNGNVANPIFTVKANGFSRSGYIWTGWMSGSTGYAAGQSVTLSSSLSLAAQWHTASAITFAYNGSIQAYTVPVTGLYRLRVSGASGANTALGTGGAGGTSHRYVQLSGGQVLYIVCGGSGGYNGGGVRQGGGYNGGGATHIATHSGTLAQLGSASGLLVVAGGGGSAGNEGHESGVYNGGAGGGLTGGNGSSTLPNYGVGFGTGGTQNSGGHHVMNSSSNVGTFGQGANTYGVDGGAGGGGLYGGGGGGNYNGGCPGGGGSGYIGSSTTVYKGSTYTNATTQGGNTGNGSASIQLICI